MVSSLGPATPPSLERAYSALLVQESEIFAEQQAPTRAVESAREAVRIMRSQLERMPNDIQSEVALIASLDHLGDALKTMTTHGINQKGSSEEQLSPIDVHAEAFARSQKLLIMFPSRMDISNLRLTCWEKVAEDEIERAPAKSQQMYNAIVAERRTLANLIHTPESKRDLAVSLDRLAYVHKLIGNYSQSIETYKASLDIAKDNYDKNKDNSEYLRDLASAHQSLAQALDAGNRSDEAIENFRKDVFYMERLTSQNPSHIGWRRELLVSYEKLARALAILRPAEALSVYGQGLISAKRLVAELPSDDGAWTAVGAFYQGVCTTSLIAIGTRASVERAKEEVSFAKENGIGRPIELAKANGRLSWYALLDHDANLSLAAGEEAFRLQPKNPILLANYIHALIYNNRIYEARQN